MTDILIPPRALEAGARALIALRVDADVWPHLSDLSKHQYMEQARAAFTAMVEAWPGMERHTFPESGSGDEYTPPIDEIFLPLTEKPDGE